MTTSCPSPAHVKALKIVGADNVTMPECARAAIRLEACRANWLAADLRADAKALYAAMGTMRYTYGKPRGITLYPMYDPQHRAGRRITPTIVAQFRANAARYQTAADILFAMSR